MSNDPDLLLLRGNGKDAEVLGRREASGWKTPQGKKERVICDSAPPGLYWAYSGRSKTAPATIVDEAVQILDLTEHDVLRSDPATRTLPGVKPGSVLICVRSTPERWFGPAPVALSGNAADPSLVADVIDEVEAPKQEDRITLGSGRSAKRYLAPGFRSPEQIGCLDARGASEVYQDLFEILLPETQRRIEELAQRSPAILTRLQIAGDSDLKGQEDFIKSLLELPVFSKVREERERAVEAEIQRKRAEASGELDRLRTESEDFVTQMRSSALEVLKNLQADPQVIAILTALGMGRPEVPAPVLAVRDGFRELLEALTSRASDEKRLALLEGQVQELASRELPAPPAVDLEPVVSAISSLARSAPQRTTTSPAVLTPTYEARVILDPEDLSEALSTDLYRALAVVARTGHMPILVGEGAAETASAFSRLVSGGRWRLVPVPSMLDDVRTLLRIAEVESVVNSARRSPDKLFTLALDGINRAPTESYLESLLALRSIGEPLPGSEASWPENLLLVGTLSHGATTLSVARGVWERAIPLPTEPREVRLPKVSEIALELWNTTSETGGETPSIESYLPEGLPAPTVSTVIKAIAVARRRLDLRDGDWSIQGAVCAACLSRQEVLRPRGFPPDRDASFKALFPSPET